MEVRYIEVLLYLESSNHGMESRIQEVLDYVYRGASFCCSH